MVARSVDGPLNATTSGGQLQVDGLTGPLTADTGSGPLNASGIASATARVSTGGGSAWISFTKAPQSVQVTTGSGDAVLVLPGGPYAVSADVRRRARTGVRAGQPDGGQHHLGQHQRRRTAGEAARRWRLRLRVPARGPASGSRAGRWNHASVLDDGA